ncbi:MAG: radical SAM protein [Elusimicrobia bacterium CG08_land_8_20_14_0_20_51_18]|nr:MAG: radical SAM protein [Elusimicrobia bacterium CG08_land_8_20_14_0_20_51_18]
MKAKIQPRIHSSEKGVLENAVPLSTPYSMHIDICSLCNFKCKFCFQADEEGMKKKGLKRGLMKMELFKKIIDDSAKFPEKFRKVKIGLHGEPTMHPELPRMIDYVRSRNVTGIIELFTNGSLLNPKLNRAMIDAGLDRINISVEGLTPEKYKEITGVAVDMTKFAANLKDLYEARKDCKIYVKVVDEGLAEDDKKKFYDTFGDICDEIFVEHMVPQWSETNKFSLETTGMYGQKVSGYKKICPFIFMYMHVNYDGTVSPCTLDWSKEVLIGDVTKESVTDIWRGKKMKDLQIAQLEGKRDRIPLCSTCMAPMVCCEENLDPHAEILLKKIKG